MLTGVTAAVLTGGNSRRFGRDKVIERLNGVMLVDKVASVLKPLFPEIILVGYARPETSDYTTIPDITPGCGPLGGIYTALVSSKNPYCFIFAADMPNLNPSLIKYMAGFRERADIVIPRMSKGMEPLHAIYSSKSIPIIEEFLAEKVFKISRLIERMNTRYIELASIYEFGEPGTIFANINRLSDFDVFPDATTKTGADDECNCKA